MSESFWNLNAAVLGRHPHVVERLRSVADARDAGDFRVEPSRKGDPTLIVSEPSGRSFTYHSKYDPRTEAARQLDAVWQADAHVLILGFGFGYAVEAVLQRLGPKGLHHQVAVVEPDVRVLRLALEHRDLRPLLADPRVDWNVGLTPDEVGERWNMNLDWTALDGLVILDHPPSRMRHPGYFERVVEKIRYLCNRSKGNLTTLMHSGFDFHTNYFLNLSDTVELPGVARLFDRFAGVPAIITAAGPSLEKNVHLLREVKGRFLIIGVDTTLRQLVHQGIRPDLVCAADPSYENSLDFVGVEQERDVVLVVEPMTHNDILQSFQGPRMIMSFGGGMFPLVQPHREPIGTVACWGSIATTAFDLARRMGCDPIVFIGLDLSFQDGRLYARGSYSDDLFYDKVHHLTSLEQETAEYILTRGVYRFDRPDGTDLFTDQNMHLYRAWFEDQFRQTRQTVINATEGGVVRQHVVCQPLAEVIRTYLDRGTDIGAILREALDRPVQVDRDAVRATFSRLLKDLRHQQGEVRQGTAALRKLSRSCAGIRVDALSGPDKVDFLELLQMHDRLCGHAELFPWLSIHQTRFITRHTMEVKTLRDQPDVMAAAWLGEMAEFLAAMTRFHEYQIPLLERSLQTLETRAQEAQRHCTPGGDGRCP